MMETLEVSIAGVANVPAKYKPFIEAFVATSPGMFQEMADGWIAAIRLEAARAGVEVDDVVAAAVEEARNTLGAA